MKAVATVLTYWSITSLLMLCVADRAPANPCMFVANQTTFLADPDGNCSTFYVCSNGHSLQLSCQPAGVWNEETSACVPRYSVFDHCSRKHTHEAVFCEEGLNGTNPYQDNCAHYFDCHPISSNGGRLLKRSGECPYPMLFNSGTRRCEPYRFVQCGPRYEPTEPCEYLSNRCQMEKNCEPCQQRFPSCSQLEDGLQPWSGQLWTSKFMTCKDQRVLYRGDCPSPNLPGIQSIFHPTLKICVSVKVTE
ncbi:uncharacterized protein LOC118763669 [Octopus sinensis]|uniref:Uncharacterized protein LOC118763669 n=1 Tax=Octopus sinensis TaxID=2607531 RepID=A0A7E6EVE4_9MOLL|nr:uncharacterized protein LOC118763669 [Octopus sinensis]